MIDDIKDVVSVSVRIDTVTPKHVYISIFQAMAYRSMVGSLANYTRGLTGTLTMDKEAAATIIARLEPVLISFEGDTWVTENDGFENTKKNIEKLINQYDQTKEE